MIDQENVPPKNIVKQQNQSATVSKLRSNIAFARKNNFTTAYTSVKNAIENRQQALKRLITTGNAIDQEQELVEEDFQKYQQLFSDLRITSIVVLQALQLFKNQVPSGKQQKSVLEYVSDYQGKMNKDYLKIKKTPLGKYFYITQNDPLLSKGNYLTLDQLHHFRPIPISEHHQEKIQNFQSVISPSKSLKQNRKLSNKPPISGKRQKYEFQSRLKSINKRDSRSQNALDNRSISSHSRTGSNGKRYSSKMESQRRILETYVPKSNGQSRQFRSNFERKSSSRQSNQRILKPNSSESKIKLNKGEIREYINRGGGRAQAGEYMNGIRDGISVQNSPISIKSHSKGGVENTLKYKKQSLPGKIRAPFASKHSSTKVNSNKITEAYQPQGSNVSKVLGRRIETPQIQKIQLKTNKTQEKRFVQLQDGYVLEPLDVLQSQISLMLKSYQNQLDFGMKSSFIPHQEILSQIKDNGFESMFLKLTENKVTKGIVIFTNDATSYLKKRVKIYHMTVLERGERALHIKRLAEMTLNYIWKYTLADEIKIELLHHRQNEDEDLQADQMIKSTLKEHKFRWKSLLNQNDRRGEVMGRNRAEVQTL